MKSIFLKKIQSDKCGMKFMDLEYKHVKTMFDSQIPYPCQMSAMNHGYVKIESYE
jgi:hypothetical protein